jgi:glycosyltransferase involved in cell wall biosynthesis
VADLSTPRVLQVVLSLNPGGTERLVADLATRLNAALPTAICCLDQPGDWAPDLERQGIRVASLDRKPGFHSSLGRALAGVAADHGATVLHAHHYSPFVYSALARLSRPGLKVVFTEHGRLSDRGPSGKRRVANQLLRRFAHRVFTVSEDVRQHLIAEGFRADSVGVIYNGIDVGPSPDLETRTTVREELDVGADELVVGTIARLSQVKNLEVLIDALARVRSAGLPARAIIVGDGPRRAALESAVPEAGVTGAVHFLGHREDARRWLAGCDVYVNCSISEGVSLTILEAMAAGLPVVATRVGGTPEVVTEVCGRLVPARDAVALADAILELGQDQTLRQRLGDAARERVEESFTLDRMIDEYRQVYESLSG